MELGRRNMKRKLNGLDDNLSQQPLMCVMLCTIHDSCPPQKKVEICPRSVMQGSYAFPDPYDVTGVSDCLRIKCLQIENFQKSSNLEVVVADLICLAAHHASCSQLPYSSPYAFLVGSLITMNLGVLLVCLYCRSGMDYTSYSYSYRLYVTNIVFG
uniref:G_PROTEIN_RECEP_F2_4 domain-containing protein n=1 Tax=Ascaris lumbricoides TaxID=6252 RepID=A0A0M3I859_ASCLU